MTQNVAGMQVAGIYNPRVLAKCYRKIASKTLFTVISTTGARNLLGLIARAYVTLQVFRDRRGDDADAAEGVRLCTEGG